MKAKPTQKSRSGFTLLELMIVLAVLAILCAIALPEYQVFQGRAKRTEALSVLRVVSMGQASYFSTNDTYTSDMYKLAFDITAWPRIFYNHYLGATYPKEGFHFFSIGNIDHDPYQDILLYKVGRVNSTIAPYDTAPDGVYQFQDDLTEAN